MPSVRRGISLWGNLWRGFAGGASALLAEHLLGRWF